MTNDKSIGERHGALMSEADAPLALRNKSVAWVTPILGRGGGLMYMDPLLACLAQQSREFRAITAEYGGPLPHPRFRIEVASGVRRIYWRGRDGYHKGFLLIGPHFIRALSAARSDLTFLVEFGPTTLYGMLLRSLRRRSRVVLVVESRPVPNEGSLLRLFKLAWRRRLARMADAFLTNNEAGRQYLLSQLGAQANRIVCRPYLVSTSAEDSNESDLSRKYTSLTRNSCIEFLFVGRLIPQKGLQHLIAALGMLSSASWSRIRVHIVGDGPERAALEAEQKRHGFREVLVFHGNVDYPRVRDFYASAHVFVYPTLRDYRALAPFEALSAGMPIISSMHDGGVSENVVDGCNGFVVEPTDHGQFARVIQSIVDQPELLLDRALYSLQLARRYTVEEAVKNMVLAGEVALRAE